MIKRIGSPIPFVSKELFGGKGKNLLELADAFPIPEGFVVSSEVYGQFFLDNDLQRIVEDIVSSDSDFSVVESKVKESFSSASFSSSLESSLVKELNRLQRHDSIAQAVRSSGVDEDGAVNSFAGQHDSFFASLTPDSFFDYLKRCYASGFNAIALKYRFDHDLGLPKAMAVVVQNLKQFRTGFVAYSAAPGDYNQVLIEAAPGHCRSVVDGRPVDSFRVDIVYANDSFTVFDSKTSLNPNKSMMWQFKDGSLQLIPSSNVDSSCLSDQEISDVAYLAVKIEQFYAHGFPSSRQPQDIEGGFDYNGKLWVTQSRDITGMSFDAPDISLPDLKRLLGYTGNIGFPGVYDGPVVVVDSVDPYGTSFSLKDGADIQALDAKFSSGYVLLTPETNPSLDYHLNNCKAIVATDCGIMSHAGATARERGLVFIGCVQHSDPNSLSLSHGDVVCVAANKSKGIVGYR